MGLRGRLRRRRVGRLRLGHWLVRLRMGRRPRSHGQCCFHGHLPHRGIFCRAGRRARLPGCIPIPKQGREPSPETFGDSCDSYPPSAGSPTTWPRASAPSARVSSPPSSAARRGISASSSARATRGAPARPTGFVVRTVITPSRSTSPTKRHDQLPAPLPGGSHVEMLPMELRTAARRSPARSARRFPWQRQSVRRSFSRWRSPWRG